MPSREKFMDDTEYERFHFKIDEELKGKIDLYSIMMNVSCSAIINDIIDISFHFIEKYNFTETDLDFPLEPLQSEDMDVYLEFKFKNALYKLQGDFNLRSKAQVLRFILRFFFDKLLKHGWERLERFYEKTKKVWEKIKRSKFEWKKSPSHMWNETSNYLTKIYTNFLQVQEIILSPPPLFRQTH